MSQKIRVVVVDDSALMRRLLTELLNGDPDIEVVGTAADPYKAREMIKEKSPDVITLDVEMPRMDGLAFLERIMTLRPMPVIMVSSLTEAGADVTLKALELGAFDFVPKPKMDLVEGMRKSQQDLARKVKEAAKIQVQPLDKTRKTQKIERRTYKGGSETIVAIGASTGGVEALRFFLETMPANGPGIVIVQHMPERFTTSFAARLNGICEMTVQEAGDLERVLPGHVYISPGNRHLKIEKSGANFICRLFDAPLVSGHKPSVDVLFHSVAEVAKQNAVGVIMTGMGRDGADGLAAMRSAGATTLGQSEASCVVYGMPKAAKEAGAVEREMPLSDLAGEVLKICHSQTKERI